ncbi:TetR family transcriptional regulator [Prauserella shujinwangii]|uniref:TetR family transcriptional regulator n=1 Tax=Prauserella shujinwangii TaxID=1453103 RepID=A0A2T0LQW8_9PSEU|nr:TetR/AcrR family transcriptional regulator [Prauserella shujinwangii]PRX45878.1 TetR family transcriptional regulator [Prauserella shujinwangii]
MAEHGYHHGALRQALLSAAADVIGEHGAGALSLRELARRAGVSHAAPQHHFGDKAGLLTAFAEEGFARLADALAPAGDDLLELGVAYVRFALGHPAHFQVMFVPALYRTGDPGVAAARKRSWEALTRGVERQRGGDTADGARKHDLEDAVVAAWSIAHGYASLCLSGALPAGAAGDVDRAARAVLGRLTGQPG